MNIPAIHAVMAETQTSQLTFPGVVRRLMEVGVESYFCDAAAMQETFYLRDGQTHTAKMMLPHLPIAEEFSKEGIVAAVRGAQNDTIRYPEFMRQATAVVVIAYWAYLTGRKVVYFGRKGEMHTEDFPGAKP